MCFKRRPFTDVNGEIVVLYGIRSAEIVSRFYGTVLYKETAYTSNNCTGTPYEIFRYFYYPPNCRDIVPGPSYYTIVNGLPTSGGSTGASLKL
jgi:hypothetical protein